MDEQGENHLELADWRRRIATLYAEVRQMAATDPAAALAHWQMVREWLYRAHPQSPVPMSERAAFRGRHFPHDPTLRFEVPVMHGAPPAQLPEEEAETTEPAGAVAIPMSGGRPLAFRRVGWVHIPFPAGGRRLALLWVEGYAGGLFLPFRDATNGSETYGAGRYVLDGAKSADLGGDGDSSTLIVDFNFAYHPSCAFDPRWACPLAPPENRLDLAIRAGEQIG